MAHTVFICHSARDKQVADAACAVLESHRIPCWIAPRDILASDEWGEAIVDAINDCRVVLIIFSAHANTSPHVRREIERAVTKGKIILPFRIEDVEPTGAMEFALGNTHWLDAFTPPLDANFTELAETVSRILNRTSSPPVSLLQISPTSKAAPGSPRAIPQASTNPTRANAPQESFRTPPEQQAHASSTYKASSAIKSKFQNISMKTRWIVAIALFILWFIAFVVFAVTGGWIHLFVFAAMILAIVNAASQSKRR